MKIPFTMPWLRWRRLAWLDQAAGAVVGLFVARVALEASARPWPGLVVGAVGLLSALVGLVLGRWLVDRGLPRWPGFLLLAYLLAPRRNPALAAGAAALAVLAWSLAWKPDSRRAGDSLPVPSLADVTIFALALAIYGATTAPGLLAADAGEFQLVATRLGVAHPPGYPLYTLVGHLFIRLIPWGTPACRLNLLSAVLAATTLVLLSRATRLWARRLGSSSRVALVAGLAAALTLGTATTFWAQATIANIRTPTALFTALALYALARFATAGGEQRADRALILLALAMGHGIAHHPSLAFPGLFFLLYLVSLEPRLAMQPRRWWRPALAGLTGLLPLAYLPIRGAMGAAQAPADLATLPGFLQHVLARGFAGDMFAFANPIDLPHRLALVPTLFRFQFSILLLIAALLGFLGLLWRDRKLLLLLLGGLGLHTFVTITYRAPQTVEYLMPAYLPLAVAVGLLPALLDLRRPLVKLTALPSIVVPFFGAVVLFAGLLNGWTHAPSFFQLADDHTVRQTAEPLLQSAPDGARILADWRWVTPLRYLQLVEGLREDVEVKEVYPVRGEDFRDTWLRRVQDTPADQPLLLAHFYHFPDYTTEPWEAGFLLRPRPVESPAAPLRAADAVFGDRIRLLGYSMQVERASPAQVLELVLAWQPAGQLDPQPSFTVRLVDGEGRHVAQADRALDADTAPGEVRFERLALPVYPALPPGEYRLVLGTYTVVEGAFEMLPAAAGGDTVSLASLEVAPSPRAPLTLHRRWVPFAGGPTLVGVDMDRTVPDVLRVYLHWRGPVDGPAQARVWTAMGEEATVVLPSLPAGGYATVAIDLPGARGPLRLALIDETGETRAAAGAWGWQVEAVRLPTAAEDARFVPLGDQMALVGVEAQPAPPGETMRLDLTFVALRPLVSDVRTSVRLMGNGGQWLAAHDGQPGLGALSTLKWIRGTRVVDRHLLAIPPDFTGNSVQATLVAYEWFRMTPLVPMDGRFEAVPLGTWTQP